MDNCFLAEKYVREVVNEGGAEDECVDSDGEVLGFETLMFAIFDFVETMVESKRFKPAVKSGLTDLMYYIVIYMQITGNQRLKLLNTNQNYFNREWDPKVLTSI